MKAIMSQMTPQTCEGQQPQISANTDASLELTFRLIVSSIVSHKTAAGVSTQVPGSSKIIHTIHAAHDANEEYLEYVSGDGSPEGCGVDMPSIAMQLLGQ